MASGNLLQTAVNVDEFSKDPSMATSPMVSQRGVLNVAEHSTFTEWVHQNCPAESSERDCQVEQNKEGNAMR
jgi:hypothetical protein